jgi:hypothetical protein
VARDVRLAVYTEELFATDNDVDNRAAVAAVASDELRLVGLALHDRRGVVDKTLDGLPPPLTPGVLKLARRVTRPA